MLREPFGTPPHLALTGDAIKRLAAILRHAARLNRIGPVRVETITVSYAGAEWTIDEDGDGVEWWTDTVTGARRQGVHLTRGSTELDESSERG